MNPLFKVWKKIRLGTGLRTCSDFYAALKGQGVIVGGYANGILRDRHFAPSIKEITVNLVNTSVRELGFNEPTKRADIYRRAFELGLELCPTEVGPQLPLQYKDQPVDERLTIAMESVLNADGDPSVFFISHKYGARRLSGDYGYYDLPYNPEDRFIFVSKE